MARAVSCGFDHGGQVFFVAPASRRLSGGRPALRSRAGRPRDSRQEPALLHHCAAFTSFQISLYLARRGTFCQK